MPKKDEVTWTKERIKQGLHTFHDEYGYFPTSHDIDAFEGLPSSRQIQRSYGGLMALRREFGLVSFNSGAVRSEVAIEINKRGLLLEAKIATFLIQYFGEIAVHSQKPYASDSKKKLDFYVYTPSYNFGVDVFFAKDFFSLQGSLGSKLKRYSDFPQHLFLVYDGTDAPAPWRRGFHEIVSS